MSNVSLQTFLNLIKSRGAFLVVGELSGVLLKYLINNKASINIGIVSKTVASTLAAVLFFLQLDCFRVEFKGYVAGT